jgi:hypothetical protein
MARRGWGSSIMLAFLAAAGTAAAQLGLGYGLRILVWVPDRPDLADAAWAAGLAWTVWVAAVAVVVGADVGDRSAGNVYSGPFVRFAGRLTLALAAALGACVTIPLVAVPTQRVLIVDNFAPNLLAGIYAGAGVVLGLLIALIALASRAIATNVLATAVFLWAVAVVAAATADGRTEVTQLGIWRFTQQGPIWHSFYIPGALLMLGGALLIGGLAAFPTAGAGASRFGVTLSGLAGPAVVAVAYALAAPRPGHATVEQLSAFYTSPYMVVAGLVGSGLVAVAGSGPSRKARRKVPRQRPLRAPTSTASQPTPPAAVTPHTGAQIGAPMVPPPPPAIPAGLTPSAGRRSAPLPAPSPGAVTAKASVPSTSRATPGDEWRRG